MQKSKLKEVGGESSVLVVGEVGREESLRLHIKTIHDIFFPLYLKHSSKSGHEVGWYHKGSWSWTGNNKESKELTNSLMLTASLLRLSQVAGMPWVSACCSQ